MHGKTLVSTQPYTNDLRRPLCHKYIATTVSLNAPHMIKATDSWYNYTRQDNHTHPVHGYVSISAVL